MKLMTCIIEGVENHCGHTHYAPHFYARAKCFTHQVALLQWYDSLLGLCTNNKTALKTLV